jgi:hypothetical protein
MFKLAAHLHPSLPEVQEINPLSCLVDGIPILVDGMPFLVDGIPILVFGMPCLVDVWWTEYRVSHTVFRLRDTFTRRLPSSLSHTPFPACFSPPS